MGRIVKYLLGFVGAFVVIFILAAVALTLFFDANDFREEISTAVEKETGRELAIAGDISLSVFPWLAVEVGNTRLGDAPGFGDEPFAEFDSARFGVRLIPILFSQKVVVGTANIDGLQLNLKIDARGNSNWADLVPDETSAEDSGAAADPASADIDISGFDISNSTVRYRNAESDETILIEELNVSIGRFAVDGTPVPISGGLTFDVQPANMAGNVDVQAALGFDAASGIATLGDLVVDGRVAGVASIPTALRISSAGIEVATAESAVTVQPVEVELLDMRIAADVQPFTYDERITPVAKISIDAFSPRNLMRLFDVEAPVTADPDALSRVIVDATAQLTTTAVELRDLTIKLDDTTFTGSLSVPRSTTDAYQIDLSGDAIDLARYMEPATDGNAASASDEVPVEIPVDLIKPLNARGKLRLAKADLSGIVLTDMALTLNSSNGQMRLYPISAKLFGGAYSGDVSINVAGAQPVLSVNERIENVNLANLAQAMFEQENVTGLISGNFKLSGRGETMTAIQRDLAGNMAFELKDGSYEGTDIWWELRRARALLKQQEPPQPTLPARTRFSKVSATGVVSKGVMQNNDLAADLPFLRMRGSGSVDLAAATVNYGLTATVLERPEFLDDASEEELEEFSKAVIPLKITGPLASPSVKPDLEKLLRQELEDEVKDKLKDKLNDLFR